MTTVITCPVLKKGVQTCVSDKLHHEIIFIPCGARSSNLAVRHACNCSTEFTSLFDLSQGLYNYVTASAKRHLVF